MSEKNNGNTKENAMNNMYEVLSYLEEKTKGKQLFQYMIGEEIIRISSEQFYNEVRRKAKLLASKNLYGKKIGIIGISNYEWIVNLCAVFWMGGVAVLLDRELDIDLLMDAVTRVTIDAILYDESVRENIACLDATILDKIPMNETWNTDDSISVKRKDGATKDDLSCIFFTSGTTSKSKAIMMSNGGMIASVCQTVNDRNFQLQLAVLPFHHLAGFATILNTLYLGAEVCIAIDLRFFYRYLEKMKPDYVILVPSMLRMLTKKLINGGENGKLLGWNLRMINCSGAPFCSEVLEVLVANNIKVLQGYGASEAGAIGFFWEMTLEYMNAIGKPPKQLDIKVVENELYLKSESIMMGYYGDEKATKEVLKDGWYATGDICRVDDDGMLYIIGRKKNLIVLSNGENVSPEEIEVKLNANNFISEVVVEAEGDVIVAKICIDSSEGNLSDGEIKEKVNIAIRDYNKKAVNYKQIRKVVYQDQPLEKTAIGKIKRNITKKGESV